MKNYSVLLAVCLCLLCSIPAFTKDKKDEVSHSTYSVPSRFKSYNVTDKQNYKYFDFLYLMAMPSWKAEDFDLTQEQINEKYVDDFSYEELGKGMPQVPMVIKNAQKANSKVLCSFPGQGYDVIAKDPQRRLKFARMMAAFADKFNYDGIDLDWENTIDRDLHIKFMSDIRQALNDLNSSKYLYLTTALSTAHRYTKVQADALSECTDWINIMSYGMGGGFWSKTVLTHNAPLDVLKHRLENFWSVFSPDKLCIGLANYGFGYRGLSPKAQLPADINLKEHLFSVQYFDLEKWTDKDWVEEWDEEGGAPFYYSPDKSDFITIDTPRSIQLKLDWIFNRAYRGVFWWEFHMDIDQNRNPNKSVKHLLIDDVNEIIDEFNEQSKN